MPDCVCDLYLIQITLVYPTENLAAFTVVDVIKQVAFFRVSVHISEPI